MILMLHRNEGEYEHLNDVVEDMCNMYYDLRRIEQNVSQTQSCVLNLKHITNTIFELDYRMNNCIKDLAELRKQMLRSKRQLWASVHNIRRHNKSKIHKL